MTYYETPRGAKDFAAGVMSFGSSVVWRPMRRLMENLWRHLSVP